MEPLARERFLNLSGEKHARIDANQSVYGEKARIGLNETTLAFRILSPLLFLGPEVLFKKMEMLWVDRIAYAEPWNHFFDELSQDWTHQLVYVRILRAFWNVNLMLARTRLPSCLPPTSHFCLSRT
jgi:hypothetical protein